MRLRNQVALITGAARGQEDRAEVNDRGGDASYVDLDVTNEGAWIAAIADTVDLFGALHILVNPAGILRGRQATKAASCRTGTAQPCVACAMGSTSRNRLV